MKKIIATALTLALAGGVLAGCSAAPASSGSNDQKSGSTSTEQQAPKGDVEMQYISPADTQANLSNDEYLVIDVRKAADYEAGHIPGSISADMDAAKGGDTENGVETMKAALKEATGDEKGGDKKLVLVCYSGKSYAQAGTNALATIGANMDNVLTMEGGMKAWTGDTEK